MDNQNIEIKQSEEDIHIPEDLLKSIGELNNLCAQQEDTAAAELYRLMFKHERNINILDYYADTVLDSVLGFVGVHAEEDYNNYLQYLKIVLPTEYEEHHKLLTDLLDDDFEEE